MAERQDSDREVLTSLPRSRPVRRSAKRGPRGEVKAAAKAAPRREAAAKKKPASRKAGAREGAAPKATPAADGTAAAREKARGAAAPRATRKAQGPAEPQATRKEHGTARPARNPAAKGAPAARERTAPDRKVPPAGYAAPDARRHDSDAANAADVLSTTIQAAAELAQIGLTVGRQTLQSMLDRLPKP